MRIYLWKSLWTHGTLSACLTNRYHNVFKGTECEIKNNSPCICNRNSCLVNDAAYDWVR